MPQPLIYMNADGVRVWRCLWCGAERDVRSFHGTHVTVGHRAIGFLCVLGNAGPDGEQLDCDCESAASERVIEWLGGRLEEQQRAERATADTLLSPPDLSPEELAELAGSGESESIDPPDPVAAYRAVVAELLAERDAATINADALSDDREDHFAEQLNALWLELTPEQQAEIENTGEI